MQLGMLLVFVEPWNILNDNCITATTVTLNIFYENQNRGLVQYGISVRN